MPALEKNHIYRSTIEGYSSEGLGVARIDGQVVFVHDAVRGEDCDILVMKVLKNVAFGKPDATREEIIRACDEAYCDHFIRTLPKGYDTVVGGAGGHLSGGERQRIAIARAMLKNAPIIILDEATAFTDPENEAMIQSAVAKLTKGKTLIVIAHRLSTITNSDQIFVVEDGKIRTSGTHEELLAQDELYARMWRSHISVRDTVEGGAQE